MARKQINLRIEEGLCDFIDEMFPGYGGRQWFFETCAEQFKKLYDANEINPPADGVDAAVREMMTLADEVPSVLEDE